MGRGISYSYIFLGSIVIYQEEARFGAGIPHGIIFVVDVPHRDDGAEFDQVEFIFAAQLAQYTLHGFFELADFSAVHATAGVQDEEDVFRQGVAAGWGEEMYEITIV